MANDCITHDITGLAIAILLVISEVLPFIKSRYNGVAHMVVDMITPKPIQKVKSDKDISDVPPV
jgi:hypothetical protein